MQHNENIIKIPLGKPFSQYGLLNGILTFKYVALADITNLITWCANNIAIKDSILF
jgi:hypothetical protein